jgi:uncharacterized protein (TIGR00251 family)
MSRGSARGGSRPAAADAAIIGCRKTAGGWELRIHVQPGAARTELAGTFGDAIKVRVSARALEGRANRALIEFLADLLGVPRARVVIVAGEHSRDKRILIQQEVIDLRKYAAAVGPRG